MVAAKYPISEALNEAAHSRLPGSGDELIPRREVAAAIQERLKIEERLSKFAATAPGIIYAFRLGKDGKMSIPYASPKLEDLLGLRPDDLVDNAKPAFRLVHPEDIPSLRSSIFESARTLNPWNFTFRLRHPKNGLLWIEGRSVPEHEPDGSTLWHGFLLDVSERKVAEERMREQADMLDLARDAIIVRGFHDQKITFWNKGAERLYGWSAAEACGRDIAELLAFGGEVADAVSKQLLCHDEWRGEVRQKSKTGKELIISTRATLVRGSDGEPKSVLVINTNVTEQRELEVQFFRAQRMESIGTLASGLAHDLNNIFSPILMSLAMLKLDISDQDRVEIIKTIEMSAKRGGEIVKQVLAYGRGLEGVRTDVQIKPLVTEVQKILQETFPKSVAVDVSIQPDLWSVSGDATQIHQILLNLCVNARDAMSDGGKLTLEITNVQIDQSFSSMEEAAEPGPFVCMEVRDTGTGIPLDVIERIFDPFFTTKGLGKGTGLGLSIVLGIVKSHGGFVRVANGSEGGACFKVFLPAQPDVVPSEEEAPAEEQELPRGRGEMILVVDDEQPVREAVQRVLVAHRYTVCLAQDGAEALAIFARNPGKFAAVLTDLMMPHMDGVAFIHALRRLAPRLPIIASTGLAQKAQLAALQAQRVETILRKPYDSTALIQALESLLHPQPPKFPGNIQSVVPHLV